MSVFATKKDWLVRSVSLTAVAVFALSFVAPLTVSASDDPVTNHNSSVTAFETKEALEGMSGVLGSSDQVATKTDADSAIVSNVAGSQVDAPKDPEKGVTFGATGGPKLEVELPNADQATNAKTVAPGVVAYDSGNGSASAVQATEDGSVRMLTIIDNPRAPTAYDYRVTVPSGGHIELTESGSASVMDINGEVVFSVATPWAKDANENIVQTWFTTDGQTLTQHVKHNVPGVAYPVTADPWVKRWYGWDIQLNRRQTNNVMLGLASATAASLGIPDPTVTKILAAGLGVFTGYANWAYNNGGCLKIRITYVGFVTAGHYYGGNCR